MPIYEQRKKNQNDREVYDNMQCMIQYGYQKTEVSRLWERVSKHRLFILFHLSVNPLIPFAMDSKEFSVADVGNQGHQFESWWNRILFRNYKIVC